MAGGTGGHSSASSVSSMTGRYVKLTCRGVADMGVGC